MSKNITIKNVAGFHVLFLEVIPLVCDCLEFLNALGTMECQMEGEAALGRDSVVVDRRRCGCLETSEDSCQRMPVGLNRTHLSERFFCI